MFSDLVGSTALSARMDPEDLREYRSAPSGDRLPELFQRRCCTSPNPVRDLAGNVRTTVIGEPSSRGSEVGRQRQTGHDQKRKRKAAHFFSSKSALSFLMKKSTFP